MEKVDKKVSFTVYVPQSVAEKYRDAAYWLPGETVTQLVLKALQSGIKKLEKQHGSFQPRLHQLRRGRRVR